MNLTLFAQNRMFSISLPEKTSGQYWVSDTDESGRSRRVASVEGLRGRWLLQGNEILEILGEGGRNAVELQNDTQVIPARYRSDGSRVQMFVEPTTPDRQNYRKYYVPEACRLDIGRSDKNQIVFENKYVSAHHACLIWQKGQWSVTDTQSGNGTFVNEKRVTTCTLRPGDMVYIMGLKIVLGNGFFAMNDPDGCVSVQAPGVQSLQPQPVEPAAEVPKGEAMGEMFYRSPRFCRSIQKEVIKVDSPPMRQRIDEVPLALMLGPAMTMGMTAVVMAVVGILNYRSGKSDLLSVVPTMVMSFTMLCGTLLWPMLTKRHDKKKRNAAEKLRQDKYREYLDRIRSQIYSLCAAQTEILTENSPALAECQARILERRRTLWERTAAHSDFLKLRLGTGALPLEAEIRWPESRFSVEDDYLINEVQRLAAEPKVLKDVPVTLSLRDCPVAGVVGAPQETAAYIKGLLLQITALHSYDEVKLVFVVNEEAAEEWKFGRWLPHTWSNDGAERYFATNEAEVKVLSASLEHILAERAEGQSGKKTENLPQYVLIVLDIALAEKMELFRQVLSAPADAGFSCISAAEQLRQLPKECATVVELRGGEGAVYDKQDLSGKRQNFTVEDTTGISMEQNASVLANLEIDTAGEQYTLPDMLTFLELYNVGKVEHLNAMTRWKENNPVNSLQAPVGVGTDGEKFYLNLHEKFQGPHGLVAGMTGSGKSEFIITFILSLAVNYHPDEVSFILIDYKGGGLAGAFENAETGVRLPHLAGTITNLDGAAVKRSLISIQSELRRRQAIFHEAGRISGEGTIDIYKYQKMYRNGQVTEPVPHLFIISDEFAELKAQQPEFMEQLISAARIGRSLGVHLILATQKPSGVVDDQIWSNSRFRVCLKVQERADSMDMIKRPDAAELAETGRFYLQVGFNELFAKGQSAWCGAPYTPTEQAEKNRDESVVVIDHLGRVLAEAKPQGQKKQSGGKSQVVSVVQYLSELAEGEGISARQMWLPQIPAVICLDALREKYGYQTNLYELNPVIGEYDDPFNQKQSLLTLPFSTEGNVLLYGTTGSGKTTLLNTMLYGLLRDYDADHLNLYLVDLGEETLTAFEKAPQVGGVLISGDGEGMTNLFKMLQEETAYRKKLVAGDDGDYRAYSRRTGKALPHILVVIRNYSSFSEQFELLEDALAQMTREGSKYGIYFLMTANAANAVRYRLSQNFAQVLTLQLNDRGDYGALLGPTDGVYPSKIKGRGIFKTDRTYEFQTAHITPEMDQGGIRAFAEALAANAASTARPVPILPERVTWRTLREPVTLWAFPVGVEKNSLRTSVLDLTRTPIHTAMAQDEAELGEMAQGFAQQATRLDRTAVTVLDGAELFEEEPAAGYGYFRSAFEAQIEVLYKEMVWRNNTYKTAKNQGEPLPQFADQVYLITGLQKIMDGVSAAAQDKLSTLMEKAENDYCIRFLICDNYKTMSTFTAKPWYKRHVIANNGIWVGDGISDQYTLKINKITNDLYAELQPGFGYVVRKGRPVLTKLLTADTQEKEDGRE